METLFENEYKMETKYFKEYVYNVLCKKISIIGFIIALMGIIFSCFTSNQYLYIILFSRQGGVIMPAIRSSADLRNNYNEI